MLQHLDEAYTVLNAFCQTSGIGAICFDTQLNIIASRPTKTISSDFILLGTRSVTHLLSEHFEQELQAKENNVFFTYLLEGNLACVITLIRNNGTYIGAFVTQPIFIKANTPQETQALIEELCPEQADREAINVILKRTPSRGFEKLAAIGETLNSISRSIFDGNRGLQIVCGKHGKPKGERDGNGGEPENILQEHESNIDDEYPVRQLRVEDYTKLKNAIHSGDTTTVDTIAERIVNGSMPTHQLDYKDYLRSLKNSYIKICTMACFATIEANTPYYTMLDLLDKYIRQVEKLENAFEILELMKKTLFDFARSVRVNRLQTYSKAVRQVLDYIDEHYDEKITLKTLAEHTQLSTFYLSSLIKKETGLILTDNINSVRIEKSKELLLDESLNIINIAQRVGFNYQNHFSTVFKKFTGMTPSEYITVTSGGIESKDVHPGDTGGAEILLGQMQKKLNLLPEMYDAVRIVDPRNNTSKILKNDTGELLSETCYVFWNRDSSCENCISRKAFLQNRSVFKLDKKGDSIIFAVAIPKTVGNETFIVEVLKKIDRSLFVSPDAHNIGNNAEDSYFKISIGNDSAVFNSRKELDAKLDLSVRLSKLENKPFSVILCMCEDSSDKNDLSATELQEIILSKHIQAQAAELGSESCFVGSYTNDIMLLALSSTDYERACRVAESMENDFENMAFNADGQARFFNYFYSVKTLTNKIADENELISLALIELNAKIDGK